MRLYCKRLTSLPHEVRRCGDQEYFCDIVKSKAEKAVEEYKCGSAIDDYHII